jgi:type II secretory pathway pseudopilin PulG
MIELLTVIAVIALLSAILFPVFSSVRNKVHENTTMSQMHDIGVALKLYREDFGKYPPVLLGFAQTSDGGFMTDASQTPVPINQVTYRPLMMNQKYLRDKEVFASPFNPNKDPQTATSAVYPFNYMGGPGAPVLFTPRVIHAAGKDDPSDPNNMIGYVGQPTFFYRYDSYDIGPQLFVDLDGRIKPALDSNGAPIMELHYSLDWTGLPPGPGDDARQLKYRNPPEDRTVVTWSTHQAANSSMIPVLLLSGRVKSVPAKKFLENGPLPPPGIRY